ncbi:expressed unknown protein [Seminavis robusta]|uniref:Uncharacterized protein n=1 Tax=Seminavis robusta TaxID=568900 RepID=A0A9N8HCA7_9STRA|nr:expressed unknown protein [Seminavis robusta]|eukprot:Sro373_g129100.1 n/a (924) ;mRNA; r:60020-62791
MALGVHEETKQIYLRFQGGCPELGDEERFEELTGGLSIRQENAEEVFLYFCIFSGIATRCEELRYTALTGKLASSVPSKTQRIRDKRRALARQRYNTGRRLEMKIIQGTASREELEEYKEVTGETDVSHLEQMDPELFKEKNRLCGFRLRGTATEEELKRYEELKKLTSMKHLRQQKATACSGSDSDSEDESDNESKSNQNGVASSPPEIQIQKQSDANQHEKEGKARRKRNTVFRLRDKILRGDATPHDKEEYRRLSSGADPSVLEQVDPVLYKEKKKLSWTKSQGTATPRDLERYEELKVLTRLHENTGTGKCSKKQRQLEDADQEGKLKASRKNRIANIREKIIRRTATPEDKDRYRELTGGRDPSYLERIDPELFKEKIRLADRRRKGTATAQDLERYEEVKALTCVRLPTQATDANHQQATDTNQASATVGNSRAESSKKKRKRPSDATQDEEEARLRRNLESRLRKKILRGNATPQEKEQYKEVKGTTDISYLERVDPELYKEKNRILSRRRCGTATTEDLERYEELKVLTSVSLQQQKSMIYKNSSHPTGSAVTPPSGKHKRKASGAVDPADEDDGQTDAPTTKDSFLRPRKRRINYNYDNVDEEFDEPFICAEDLPPPERVDTDPEVSDSSNTDDDGGASDSDHSGDNRHNGRNLHIYANVYDSETTDADADSLGAHSIRQGSRSSRTPPLAYAAIPNSAREEEESTRAVQEALRTHVDTTFAGWAGARVPTRRSSPPRVATNMLTARSDNDDASHASEVRSSAGALSPLMSAARTIVTPQSQNMPLTIRFCRGDLGQNWFVDIRTRARRDKLVRTVFNADATTRRLRKLSSEEKAALRRGTKEVVMDYVNWKTNHVYRTFMADNLAQFSTLDLHEEIERDELGKIVEGAASPVLMHVYVRDIFGDDEGSVDMFL